MCVITQRLSMEEVEGLQWRCFGNREIVCTSTYENDKFKVFSDHPWTLSTEISQGDPKSLDRTW